MFLHNVKASGHHDIVYPIKGRSDYILPVLRREWFDLVFVDGDHSYKGVMNDLRNTDNLVVEGGIICGDDLELQSFQIDTEYAKKHLMEDLTMDPKQQIEFHPGVSLAVGEFFGEVSAWEGFWAMRKCGSSWEKVELPVWEPGSDSIAVPKHLS